MLQVKIKQQTDFCILASVTNATYSKLKTVLEAQ